MTAASGSGNGEFRYRALRSFTEAETDDTRIPFAFPRRGEIMLSSSDRCCDSAILQNAARVAACVEAGDIGGTRARLAVLAEVAFKCGMADIATLAHRAGRTLNSKNKLGVVSADLFKLAWAMDAAGSCLQARCTEGPAG